MSKRCLYCYQPLTDGNREDFHERCSLKFFGTKMPPVLDYSLDQMADLAKNVVERSVSVPGVQPKLSLTIVNDTLADGRLGRLTVVGALGGNYIFKPPSEHFAEMPENEHVTMRIAEEVFKLRTVPSSLIRLASGELSYITKRIDRKNTGEKIHMLDMFQILEAFDKYKGSMERVGKALQDYSSNTLLDLSYYFELTLFSYLTGNNDMHLKNFSMINGGGNWGLSPAYDLLNVSIVNPADKEELALTLEGRKKKLRLENFDSFAHNLGLTDRQVKNTYTRFLKTKPAAFDWLDRSFLSADRVEAYKGLMDNRYTILPVLPATVKSTKNAVQND
jgi:serine/threonine-protein kinase HipA